MEKSNGEEEKKYSESWLLVVVHELSKRQKMNQKAGKRYTLQSVDSTYLDRFSSCCAGQSGKRMSCSPPALPAFYLPLFRSGDESVMMLPMDG
jgi:hypothetical protein